MSRDICIPISAAQSLAELLDLRQVIIVAWDGEKSHVVTYGGSVADSANAAAGGNLVKKVLGWPASLNSESPKVLALQARIAELEAQVASGGLPVAKLPQALSELQDPTSVREPAPQVTPTVHVIEGTEHERGWGCRPDGYVAFTTKEAAETFIADYNARHNTAKHAPDEYTVYNYIGLKECSIGFYKAVAGRKAKHFDRFSDLLE